MLMSSLENRMSSTFCCSMVPWYNTHLQCEAQLIITRELLSILKLYDTHNCKTKGYGIVRTIILGGIFPTLSSKLMMHIPVLVLVSFLGVTRYLC